MRWLIRSVFVVTALGALALIAVVALIWLLGSEQGAAYVLGRVQAASGGTLTIGRVAGSFVGGLALTDVRVRLTRDELDIARIDLSWNVPAAFAGTLAFDAARVGAVVYRRNPPADAEGGRPVDLDLPIDIAIDGAVVERIELNAGHEVLVFGRTTAAVSFRDARLEIEDLSTESSGVELRGDGELSFGDVLHLAADIEWAQAAGEQPFSGRLRIAGDLPVLELHHELLAPVAIVADGEVHVDSPPRVDLTVQWNELTIPGVDDFASRSGRVALVGSIEGYRFEGSGDARYRDLDTAFALAGEGRGGLLTLESASLESARGTLTASGDVALDALELDVSLAGRDVDPSLILPDWPGRLTGTAILRGALTPLVWELGNVDVTGELRGYPVAATGLVGYAEPGGWQLEQVRIASGPSSILLDGKAGIGADRSLSLELDADVATLTLFVPELEGSATADLTITGSWEEPRASGRVEARALEYRDYSVARLTFAGEAGIGAEDALAFSLDAEAVARGSIEAGTARLDVAGSASAHRFSFDAEAERWRAHATGEGGLAAGLWRGALDAFEVDEQALGAWLLAERAQVAVGRDSVVIETSCLLHEAGGRWCAELRLERKPEDRLVISAQNVDLQSLQPLLPPQLSVSGVYQLSASFADLSREPSGSLAVSGGSTPVRLAFNEQQTFETVVEDVIVGATLADGELYLTAGLMTRATGGRMNLEARIDDIRAPASPIRGNLSLFWPDLAFLALLSPNVGEIGGALEADVGIAGTVDEPEVEGGARWRDGRLGVPAWGLVVDRIEADATSPDGRELTFRANGWVDDAVLELTGTTELDAGGGWPTELRVRGDSVRAVQLPEVEIFVSPDLAVSAELPDVQVTGTVHVPRARIEISQLPEAAVAPSADAVVHGLEAANGARALRVSSDIVLTLGEAVEYLGLNLVTKVGGELRLRSEANRSTTATGSLHLTGTYNAYGQTLNLERGQLLFNGPLDEPAIDVRAVRSIESTRVGVELVGTVKAPRTRVFSDPAMSEADALSYLLLGRPISGTGGEETATLQTAALAMGLQQALPVVLRIGQSLGLDELGVQGTEADAGALTAGKYLSPKVYIRYSYGLFNRIGGLLLRFRVNERLSIETRSGDQKSMDLIYTVEKD